MKGYFAAVRRPGRLQIIAKVVGEANLVGTRDLPTVDQRILRRLRTVVGPASPAGYEKITKELIKAHDIAFFEDNTQNVRHAANVSFNASGFRVSVIVVSDSVESYAGLVSDYGGTLEDSRKFRIEAWIPFVRLIDFAADDRVKKINHFKFNALRH